MAELEPMEYCPACEQYKPLKSFTRPSSARRGDAFVCENCRHDGIQISDPLPDLPPKYRQLLLDLLTSDSVAEAARKNDLHPQYVRELIKGRMPGKQAAQVAAAWQLLLEYEGLDLHTIARISKGLLHAVEPKWNAKEERFDFFPDNSTRLGMVKHLTRQHRVDPRGSGDFQARSGTIVVINQNLDGPSEAEAETVEADFSVEVARGIPAG